MERIMSQDERIKRAEEIYNRRRAEGRNNYYSNDRNRNQEVTYDTKNIKARLVKKMITQIVICVIIYGAIYTMQHSEELFSKDFINKAKEILAYDISVETLTTYWNNAQNTLNEFLNAGNEENTNIEQNQEITNIEENQEIVNIEQNQEVANIEENISDNENVHMGVGGAEEIVQIKEKSQEEVDIEYIKQNINIIWPLTGTITSYFGTRTPTEIVSANHYGIDIGANTGDTIIAAIDGVVTLASSEGDYGKHIKIENGEVTTLYAHCSALLVEEGEAVKQGQKIAEVGETGRATRTTSTF